MRNLIDDVVDETNRLPRWAAVAVLLVFLSGIVFWGTFCVLVIMLTGAILFDDI